MIIVYEIRGHLKVEISEVNTYMWWTVGEVPVQDQKVKVWSTRYLF